MKRLKIGFLIDPAETIEPAYDTSFALMRECVRRGHAVFCCELKDLRAHDNTVEARLTPCRPEPAGLRAAGRGQWKDLKGLDAFLIRKDPPFDMSYVSALCLLGSLPPGRPFLLNDPAGILLTNEKLSALAFPPFCPPSAAGSTPEAFADFLKKPSRLGWVFKPLFDKGGEGVTWVRPAQKSSAAGVIRRLSENGRVPIVCQHFVEHAKSGDKRILILDGKILGAMSRIARKGEFRANLSKGASAVRATVTARERALVRRLAPFLKRRGLYFVGIDVLSGYLSEVNVTSPSGAPEINAFDGIRVESEIMDFIESRAGRSRSGR